MFHQSVILSSMLSLRGGKVDGHDKATVVVISRQQEIAIEIERAIDRSHTQIPYILTRRRKKIALVPRRQQIEIQREIDKKPHNIYYRDVLVVRRQVR